MSRFRIKSFTAALAYSIPLFSMASSVCRAQTNHAVPTDQDKVGQPVVKITSPANNSTYSWNALVNYSVVVSWQGKSTEYQEIPSNEVLISTTYMPDISTIADSSSKTGELAPSAAPTPAGLLAIVRSGCIGCHQFKARSTGPSFAAIAQQYPDNQATSDTLARYIHEGSTGVWGRGPCPRTRSSPKSSCMPSRAGSRKTPRIRM